MLFRSLHLHRDALTKFIDQAQAQVRVAEAQQRVEAANARLQQPGLFPDERARLLGEVRQKAQSDLTAARRQAGALGREYSAALKRSKEAERAAKAVERARTEAASVQRSKAQQARLERMQAPPGLASPPQVEIPAITTAERDARMNKLDPEKFKLQEGLKLKGNPTNILKGYESEITSIRKRIEAKQTQSLQNETRGLAEQAEYLKVLARYKAEKTAEGRAAIEPELQAATKKLSDAITSVAKTDVIWPGKAKDISDLTKALQKKEAFQQLVAEGYFETPKEAKVRKAAEVRRAEQTTEQRAAAAEAATRAEAPATTGEALTRTETAQARKPQKTVYASQGKQDDKSLLARIQQKIEDKEPLTPYERGVYEAKKIGRAHV